MTDSTPHAAAAPVPRGTGRRCAVMSLAVAVAVLVADQFVKLWVVESLVPGRQYPVIPGLLWWEHIRNSGGAFSLGSGATWFFTLVMAAVVLGILWTLRRVRNPWWALALGLVLGGAAGNLGDRLFREPGFGRGHVVDFIAVPHFAIFNVADCGVVVGIGLVLVLLLGNRNLEGPRER
ncbi:signal peptidase II [Kocuria sp.]|uniref:signal peptidase II n=1 Tax=Kocuria sp. TaxID=1871328 RepID=UPI0026DD9C90|nr:signal peptidase II [Kocuria sp.]MDO4919988.1 signal peptidase II [Kocuria sp.]